MAKCLPCFYSEAIVFAAFVADCLLLSNKMLNYGIRYDIMGLDWQEKQGIYPKQLKKVDIEITNCQLSWKERVIKD